MGGRAEQGGTSAACPLCGGAAASTGAPDLDVPVHCNLLPATREEARAAPRATIRLALCPDCGLLFNARFDPARLTYGPGYETSLHHSATFRSYAEALARELIERHGLRGRQVLEIGCGRGEFLALLCELGGNRGLGLDPSQAPPDTGVAAAPAPDYPREAGRHRIVGAELSAAVARPADLVCCRHVLEHVHHPLELLGEIARLLAARDGSVAFLEVPDAMFTLRGGGIWDVIYEHCSYFDAGSLHQACVRAGLSPLRVAGAFGGQVLTLEARLAATAPAGGGPPAAPAGPAQRQEVRRLAGDFARRQRRAVEDWEAALDAHAAAGRRVAVWGAGSKGVTFLNALDPRGERIGAVVDTSPHKPGRHVPGTGHAIVAPAALRADPPDVVVVMNPLYREEVRAALAALGLDPRITTA